MAVDRSHPAVLEDRHHNFAAGEHLHSRSLVGYHILAAAVEADRTSLAETAPDHNPAAAMVDYNHPL